MPGNVSPWPGPAAAVSVAGRADAVSALVDAPFARQRDALVVVLDEVGAAAFEDLDRRGTRTAGSPAGCDRVARGLKSRSKSAPRSTDPRCARSGISWTPVAQARCGRTPRSPSRTLRRSSPPTRVCAAGDNPLDAHGHGEVLARRAEPRPADDPSAIRVPTARTVGPAGRTACAAAHEAVAAPT